MQPPLSRFHERLSDLDPERVRHTMARVIEGLAWIDPEGDLTGEPPTDVVLCSTFGETMHEAVDVAVGRFTLRYPGPSQQRSAGLVCVDMNGQTATIDNLVSELLALGDVATLCEDLAMHAAQAAQPDGAFEWTGTGVSQAYKVVGEVEQWPGQIQLQAARVYEPDVRIGEQIWLDDRELLPVCWVLDWLR